MLRPLALALALAPLAAQERPALALDSLWRPLPGRAARASSGLFDPESNADAHHIRAGSRFALAELEGPGEIRHLWFTCMSRDRRYPRNLVLRIYWDGSEVPAVESPLGDFFAAGNGMRANVSSLPIEATSYGRSLNSYWPMPFRRSARLELHNEGPETTTVYFQCDWRRLESLPQDALYFHARYRQEYPPEPFRPYTVFEATGEGQYVGTVLSSQNTLASWFGESDDRFYVDGEREPSLVGTGLEDYFNDAWNLRLFSTLRRGVTICETKGDERRITAFRWHLEDAVPFRRSLKVEIERRSYLVATDPATGKPYADPETGQSTFDFKYRPDWFSSVAFWYHKGVAPRFWDFPPGPARLLHELFIHPQERESLERTRSSPGTRAEEYSNRICNLKRGFRFRPPGPGAWVEFPFEVLERGRYSISVWQVLTVNSGVYKATLSGPEGSRVLWPGLDFFDGLAARAENFPENHHHGTLQIAKGGVALLEPGPHALCFECVDSNPVSRDAATGAFGRGFELHLDLIAFRKLPIEDPVRWLEDYLAAERSLFAARDREARADVARLAALVEASRKETGAWPAGLGELGPDAVPGGRIPLDPWGQPYLYRRPGLANPFGFDLWSRRGNSRAPEGWIGNWPSPYRIEGAIEGEGLAPAHASPGVRCLAQEVAARDGAPLSAGGLLLIRMARTGDWAEFELPGALEPGRYEVVLLPARSWDYGLVQWSLAGRPLGAPFDGHSPVLGRSALPAALVELGPGPALLRVEALGRHPASQGFLAGLDALALRKL